MAGVDSLPVEQKVAFRRKSIRVLQDLLELSTLMVRAEDYLRARDNFFHPARKIWFMFGGTIKRFDSTLGDGIESRLNSINTMLDQASPSHESLTASLTELNQAMVTAVNMSEERI